MNNTEVISILEDLIETCSRGRRGFQNAADGVRNSEFRRLFNIFSQQRAQFVAELHAEATRLGKQASAETDVSTPTGRTLPFRSPAMRSEVVDEARVIAVCQGEEEAAVNDYQEALKADLPLDVQYVVKRQYMDIKDAYDRIRILQRAA
jgi:uncharacterized protein (TIGR02284 family)